MRAQGPAIEVWPRQLELLGDLARLLSHVLVRERVAQAVVDHRVDRLGVAHAEAEPRLLEQVRGLRHRLHPAADADLEVTGADRGVEQAGRADPGGADLVDRLGGNLLGDARLDLRLTRRDLALARLEHLAHHHLLHLVGRHLGALQRGADRRAAELGRVYARQAPSQLANGRAGRSEDHGLGHRVGSPDGRGLCGAWIGGAPANRRRRRSDADHAQEAPE